MYGGRDNAGTIVYTKVHDGVAKPTSHEVEACFNLLSPMEITDNYAPFRLGRKKKTPTQQDQRQPWPALARSRQTPPQYRDLVVVLMPCRAADRKVVSQSLGSYSRRPCSRPLEGRREHPSACPRVLPPIASHRSGTTSSNPRFHGAYCPATLSARNNVSNETASKNQGAKTPRPEQTQYILTSPLKHHKKGGTIPFHTRSTNPHPETPMHNSPPTTAVVQPQSLRSRHLGGISSTHPQDHDLSPHPDTPRVPPLYHQHRATEKVRQYTSPSPFFPSMILPCLARTGPAHGGVWCVCAAALVLCNHTIATTKARRASSQCQHGSETVSHTHTQTHGQI